MSDEKTKLKICVIGAGAAGLTSIKQCLDSGFEVSCYEKTDFIGGLWHYNEDDQEGISSVMRSTIINTSKEITAFSDFRADASLPNFMHNSQLCEYLESYADHFGLRNKIKNKHEVLKVTQADDYDETGRWNVQVRDLVTNQESTSTFDGVMVCTGHHVTPLIPKFKGQEDFGGKIFHSHSYKKPDESFVGKTALVVGNGNSGGDVAVELSSICSRTYLSTRRGFWIMSRVGKGGKPNDIMNNQRWWVTLNSWLPFFLVDKLVEFYIHSHLDHKLYNLKPDHKPTAQHSTVNDVLPCRIMSGSVIVKNNISRFTKNGVIFDDDDHETQIDLVVLATGYLIKFPFLSDEIIDMSDNKNKINTLFKHVFPVNLKHPSLAFIGLIQPLGAIFPIAESHARWFCQVMAKNVKLPPVEIMIKDIGDKKIAREKRYYDGERHSIQADWLPHMDEVAMQYGAKPDLWHYFFSDFELWWHLVFGPAIPSQFRLNGPNTWQGARDAILNTQERILAPLNTRGLVRVSKVQRKILNLVAQILLLLNWITIVIKKIFKA